MRPTFALASASIIAAVQAHFTLTYPFPRGPFNDDNEVQFCDGYKSVNTTRQLFPLQNGVLAIFSEHPHWNVEVLLSTSPDPQTLADFKTPGGVQQLAVPPYQGTGEGTYCLPIDIGDLGLSGAGDGSNVTIQVVYSGGDGTLFQCADLTLSSNASSPPDSTLQCQAAPNVPTASPISSAATSSLSSSLETTSLAVTSTASASRVTTAVLVDSSSAPGVMGSSSTADSASPSELGSSSTANSSPSVSGSTLTSTSPAPTSKANSAAGSATPAWTALLGFVVVLAL